MEHLTMEDDLIKSMGLEPIHKKRKGGRFVTNNKAAYKHLLRIIDEQDYVNRYVWHNILMKLSSQEIERLLYYKADLAFFYEPSVKEFFLMPYTLDGGIDFYGRYVSIRPLPIAVGIKDEVIENYVKQQEAFLSLKRLKVLYEVPDHEMSLEEFSEYAILLHDYTPQFAQKNAPRAELQDPILDDMARCIPYMMTSLKLSTGVKGMRIQDADQRGDVDDTNDSLERAALNGDGLVPIISKIELDELQTGTNTKAETYMLSMQSLDNQRLAALGLENGGLFEKKAHILESENAINNSNVSLIYQDGLSNRDRFCMLVNSIIPYGMFVTPSENITALDENVDGHLYDLPDTAPDANTSTEMEDGEDDTESIS